ncbi:MAG: chitobiase/beta-hexosaminidase C-terminal domain-containing protein [Victivallales bacterium]|nr:chitobiase/beta-hexosaminidase C-terminal domain-containing protein [Victivallales bacterium]
MLFTVSRSGWVPLAGLFCIICTSYSARASDVLKGDEISLSPSARKILEEKLASYPQFDPKAAAVEARKTYPLVKEGTDVELRYRNREAKGKFYGFTPDGALKIGTTKIVRIDLSDEQLSKFDPEINKKMRRMFVDRQRAGYNADKMMFNQELLTSLRSRYPLAPDRIYEGVFRKLEDKDMADKCARELLELYDASLPIADGETQRDRLRSILLDYVQKREDLVIEGYHVVSLAGRARRQEEERLREERRQQKLAARIVYPRAATPVFEPDGGVFQIDKAVAMSSSTPGAEIRYTVTGEPPDEDSLLYTEPVVLKMNQRLKAVAFHPEYNDSDFAVMAPWDGRGLFGAYFKKVNFTDHTVVRLDRQVSFDVAHDPLPEGINRHYYSVLWTGRIIPPESGEYTFYLSGDDGVRMWLAGRLLIDGWFHQARKEYKETANLVAGKAYDIKLALVELTGTSSIMLEWSSDTISRQVVPTNCLQPMGAETENLRKWNQKSGDEYVNRTRMVNPGSHQGKVQLHSYNTEEIKREAFEQMGLQ